MPGDSPNVTGMVSDPGFQSLSLGDQRSALSKLTGDSSFASLSDDDVGQFVTKMRGIDPLTAKTQATARAAGVNTPGVAPMPLPNERRDISMETPLGQPIAPAGAAASFPRAAAGLAAGYGAAKLVGNEHPWLRDAAAIAAGVVGEGATAAVEEPHPVVRGIARDMANKYLGKTAADAILPPPPTAEVPPPDMAADVANQVAKEKALRTAREQAGLRRPQADIDAERTAKARDAAYVKEGQDQLTIQQRYDDAQNERIAAEKAAKNGQLKAEQAHAANLADYEKSRQGEITAQAKLRQIQDGMDAAETAKQADTVASLKSQMAQAEKDANAAAAQTERLRTMHGDDLMRRGKEQAGLDKAAQDAAAAEDAAKAEVTKKAQGTIRPGAPTEAEQLLTRLNKQTIWTPEMERDAIRMWGTKARMQPGEGIVNYRARLQGYMYAGRAPQGMPDIESGSSTPSSVRGLPPPPSAPATLPAPPGAADAISAESRDPLFRQKRIEQLEAIIDGAPGYTGPERRYARAHLDFYKGLERRKPTP